jgi:hypothetical protein
MATGFTYKSLVRIGVLAATVLSLGFAGVEDGVVLCVGEDGHVAVENVGPEGCGEVFEAVLEAVVDAQSVLAIASSTSHCGPCVDVALSASSATGGLSVAKRGGPAVATFSIATIPSPLPSARASLTLPRVARFISEKPHTVVIRC